VTRKGADDDRLPDVLWPATDFDCGRNSRPAADPGGVLPCPLSDEEEANFEDARNASDNACESGADEEGDEASETGPEIDVSVGELEPESGEPEEDVSLS
jgi:hypothetical protein